MSTIELIGAVDGKHHYNADHIAGLLATEREKLAVGTAFTGRPDTCIYANGQNVVKIRAELDLSHENARKWTANVLQQEQQLAVHHPHKTWFIIDNQSNATVLVGSICPQLKPLNIELKPSPQTPPMREQYLDILADMFEKYLLLAKRHGYKLDEGLSNFAVDDKGDVYYLDDEYYSWDNFIAFSVMLGVFIRTYEWLDEAFMAKLTGILIGLVDGIFEDPHCRTIISTQLQSLFMPSEEKECLLKKLLTGLAQSPITSAVHLANKEQLNARKNNNNRYYAVMADIHANDAALDCVLDFYREQKITQGIILGDIVGYGPEPAYCIERLQESTFEIIKGNHDYAVATGNTSRGFSGNAITVIDWTIGQLNQQHRDWLDSLPVFSRNQHWLAVHGAPIDPAFFYGYVYQMTAEENLDCLQQKAIPLCLHGHSHMPGVYARDRYQRDHHCTEDKVDLSAYAHSLVCPGSVGQPRNGRRETQCAVYDRELQEMVFVALPYCVDSVVEKMQRYGLSDKLWQRLQTGK
ncbi:MAG: metallophosphoesterase family protein [Methylovulum sp.]|nr:metallophosphoesterase family protein [Methylovulum sp.]